ncbi:MAG: leucine--tRNA ligase [Bacteroidetes bacterium]|nr:leucine--tRNA ligase [Bacteroidota bacterium]MBU2586169.1 leucine--tRNA ligase [Bacteroidota bacterium]
MKYPAQEIETKWQKYWEEKKVNKTNLSETDKKLYSLVMFIYPSGAKLHCGHWYNYAPADSWTRFKKLQGFNVFEPMGYDAFGLPAENYAIKTGIHPQDSTLQNIKEIRIQLERIGAMYDWDHELMTCAPEYFKWNQWLFLKLYEKGLAYRQNAPVNWCESCQTVLANEQVESDGTCERCNNPVIKKNLTQWFFKITNYAEELLSDLDKIDWPEKTKTMQRNWIGKSTGVELNFKIENFEDEISVFTTRPDTLFGVTYVVLAPEHPLVDKLTTTENKIAVSKYLEKVSHESEIERLSTVKEKTGVPLGSYAINPMNNERIPIWIADYVLYTYGTGAVMAVPGHDERDFEFAKKFNLPIRKVILEPGTNPEDELKSAFVEVGIMLNSGQFNGLNSDIGIEKISDFLEEKKIGQRKINYRLRDWLISRQRYWGTPIPIIHCDTCGEVSVPEKDIPVLLPYEIDFRPRGESPLARNKEFQKVKCPKCDSDARRDPDTMDTFVDSSWYHLRFLDPKIENSMFNIELAKKWMPVDSYIGGAEHATMHLLYARFIHKFLRDIGLVFCDEPYQKLRHQGTITNQGAKMSKSKENVVNPDEFIEKYGADVFRMYLMFMGPYELGGDWSDKGIVGVSRFVNRVYEMYVNHENDLTDTKFNDSVTIDALNDSEKKLYRKVNQTIKKVTEDIEELKFNTAVAAMMELLNEIGHLNEVKNKDLINFTLERFAILLAPLAPHLAEECWSLIGKSKSIFEEPVWFNYDEKGIIEDKVTLAVQVNGKLRAAIEVDIDGDEGFIKETAKQDSRVAKFLENKQIVKEIYVKNKILNIVVK